MSEINNFNRVDELPKEGPFCDLLWSEPVEKDSEALIVEWAPNKTRGCLFLFGAKQFRF